MHTPGDQGFTCAPPSTHGLRGVCDQGPRVRYQGSAIRAVDRSSLAPPYRPQGSTRPLIAMAINLTKARKRRDLVGCEALHAPGITR
jgi:hypothetical protein